VFISMEIIKAFLRKKMAAAQRNFASASE